MNLTSKRMMAALLMAMGFSLCATAAEFADTFETAESWTTWENGVEITASAADGMAITNYKAKATADLNVNTPVWTADGADASTIKALSYTYNKTSLPQKEATHDQVLNLNTEGATLSRAVEEAIDGTTPARYVDTMVQFVASESDPVLPSDYKVAFWAKDGFLQVSAASVGDLSTGEGWATQTNFTTTVAVDAAAWYRLTVQTVVLGESAQAVRVWVDGTPVTGEFSESEFGVGDATDKVWFLCNGNDLWQFNALSVSGTGALDDVTVSYTMPTFADAPISGLILTLAFDDTLLDVTVDGAAVTPDHQLKASPATVVVKANDWFAPTATATDPAITIATDSEANVSTKTFTITAASDVQATINLAAAQYASGTITIGDLTIDAAKAATWASAKGVTEAEFSTYYNDYLLNADKGANGGIEISAIEKQADGSIKVTVSRKAADTYALNAINGTLVIEGCNALGEAFAEITHEEVTLEASETSRAFTIPVDTGKFYKAKIK